MKKVMSLSLVAALLISMLTFVTINVGAEAWDGEAVAEFTGNGTATNPYRIENAANLNYLQQMVNEGITYEGEYFVQTADIDLGSKEWTPIGTSDTPFKGVYDGKGKKITNLSITKDRSAIGLFGYVASGTDKSAGLANINVEGKIEILEGLGDRGIGGLSGFLYKDSDNLYPTVYAINCVVDVDINLNAAAKQPRVGGAFGYSFCSIVENVVYNGDAKIEASANSRLGGITGQSNRTYYKNCVNNGSINNVLDNCTAHTGGIVGMLTYKTPDYNYENGTTGEDHAHKGYTVFDHCVNNGKITATVTGEKSKVYLGGIVGATYSPASEKFLNVKLLYCVNTGELQGMIDTNAPEGNYAYVGGLFARANLVNIQIENCINTSDNITSIGGISGECKGGIVAEMATGAETEYLKNCETVGKLGGIFSNTATNCIENATATDAMVHAKEITDTLKSSTVKIGDFPTDTLEIPEPSTETDTETDPPASDTPGESDTSEPVGSDTETNKPEEPTTPSDTNKNEPNETNKANEEGGCKSGIVTIVPAIMIGLAALVVAKKKED